MFSDVIVWSAEHLKQWAYSAAIWQDDTHRDIQRKIYMYRRLEFCSLLVSVT